MLLFVYGTLRRGFNNKNSEKLNSLSKWIGKAIIPNAKLYYINGDDFDYPAMVLNNNGENDNGEHEYELKQTSQNISVIGDVFQLFDPESILVWLDEYEECGPEKPQPTEYLRKQIKAKLIEDKNGKNIENCWITVNTYIWNWPVENENGDFIEPVVELIESGDWLKHVKNRK
ncbi:hypothetical protein ACQ4LE_009841 [Meloidogyne hapla]|uniref:GGACT domain-containing protein n=1 Tax=Meloidogyne hapla TaxID=6305 RepID=A0A1I8BZ63_MELHA